MNISGATMILKLKAPFTAKQAKDNYRRLAMVCHPDKGGSVKAMANLNLAYEVCSQGISMPQAPKIDIHGVQFKVKKKVVNVKSVVRWFCDRMYDKLHKNQHKGVSWRTETALWLMERLEDEVGELEVAIDEKNKEEIIKECADVANFAMMIADNARRKL